MKKLLVLLPGFLFIMSCSEEPTSDFPWEMQETKHEAEDELEDAMTSFEDAMNEMRDDMDGQVDSMLNAMKVDFVPYDGVERFENIAPLEFNDYNYDMSFYYLFPKEAEFKATEKDDHTTYTASLIEKGTIYEISVEDYSSMPDGTIDAGFTEFMHNGLVEHMGGEVLHNAYLKDVQAEFGYYSCYTYSMAEHTYMCDHVTYGWNNMMVHLIVTSRPKCESPSRLLEFMNGFEVVP